MVSRLRASAASGILHTMNKFSAILIAGMLHSITAFAKPLGPDFTELSAAVLPTTVHIHVERGATIAAGIQQLSRDYALPSPKSDSSRVQISTGSGVIIDSRGLILTNHHVVDGARQIRITLADQRVYEATIVGHDPRTDVALLSVDTDDRLTAARFNAGVELSVGEWVVAVGHPFDFPFTVTAGIVSALGRRNLGQHEIQNYIQTDVAVNPGSSGGPLFNRHGDLVGINTAIFSPDKENLSSAGISFAIPAAMALRVSEEIVTHGRVRYSALGAVTEDAPPSNSQPQPGARIARIVAGSPAEAAGLRRGDVITAADGEPISSSTALDALILTRAIGSSLELSIRRGKRTFLTQAKTVDAEVLGPANPPNSTPKNAAKWAGLTLVDASPKRLTQMGIALPDDTQGGVLVLDVEAGSSAAKAGLVRGDVLLKLHKTPLRGVDDLLKSVDNQSVVLLAFWRGKNRYLAALAIEGEPR